jgi:hypothetical protein
MFQRQKTAGAGHPVGRAQLLDHVCCARYEQIVERGIVSAERWSVLKGAVAAVTVVTLPKGGDPKEADRPCFSFRGDTWLTQ